jgi:hypothetical protein
VLQDPHTVVATLDPLRSFGPSAFGALHLRAVFPTSPSNSSKDLSSRLDSTHADAAEKPASRSASESSSTSDWLPLGTLVRLPAFAQLQCPADDTQPCTLTGTNLFLIEAISIDPTFANPVPVPDGYTGATLALPRLTANTLFLRLRDDPTPIDSAIFPASPAQPTHTRRNAPKSATATPAPTTPAATATDPADAAPANAVPKQTGPAKSPGPSR